MKDIIQVLLALCDVMGKEGLPDSSQDLHGSGVIEIYDDEGMISSNKGKSQNFLSCSHAISAISPQNFRNTCFGFRI